MQIEQLLSDLKTSLDANTAALREVLAAGLPSNVTPITEAPKPAKKQAKSAPAPTPAVEPEPETPAAVEPEPETPVVEKPTKVAVDTPKEEEFSDPLDKDTTVVVKGSAPAPTADEIIVQITDTWKSMLTAADAERKNLLKDKFPELRAKWGLAEGAKLATLADRPENLVGLLEDIKAL